MFNGDDAVKVYESDKNIEMEEMQEIEETLGQAIESYVAWPNYFIVLNLEKIKKKKHVAPVKDLSMKDDGVKMVPSKCKALYHIAKNLMDNNSKALMSTLENEVFGVPRDLHIFEDDIIQLMETQWLGANCIVAYMRYLYEILIKSDLVDTFGFVDSARVVSFGVSQTKNVEKNLVERMQQGKSDRIFLVPYNPRNHWMLTIINEEKDIVYIADSLEKQEYPEWMETVNNAIKLFNGVTGRHGKKAPQWITLLSTPKQVGGVECGYYVMRYMKEIIEDPTISFAQLWSKKSKRTNYSQEQIDEVRNE
ncbi:hypothetical protein M0R45_030680 [Rubus argutus]|uniref:Ubiquitin-like protease family profile domain-containing protein n=1 Tax=Rubus argutus TaxID=59490 RepID=A0AAW1WFT9_RUBAR